MYINKTLNFKLYKENNLKIMQNNIAYLEKFDKILFELDGSKFQVILKDNYFELIKEDLESIFTLNNDKSNLLIKENNMSLDIKLEKLCISNINNKYIIEYKLESDEDLTKIEIEL